MVLSHGFEDPTSNQFTMYQVACTLQLLDAWIIFYLWTPKNHFFFYIGKLHNFFFFNPESLPQQLPYHFHLIYYVNSLPCDSPCCHHMSLIKGPLGHSKHPNPTTTCHEHRIPCVILYTSLLHVIIWLGHIIFFPHHASLPLTDRCCCVHIDRPGGQISTWVIRSSTLWSRVVVGNVVDHPSPLICYD